MWGGGWLRTILALALCVLLLIFYSAPLSLVVEVGEEEEMGVQMALCPCKRVLPRVNLEEVALNATTCGEDAWRRGRHQRVIAFTFFEASGDGKVAEEKESRQYLQVPTKTKTKTSLLLKIVVCDNISFCPCWPLLFITSIHELK